MANSKNPLVLIFDSGTQSTRAFLFDKNGVIVTGVKINNIPYYSAKIGYAEKNTEEYWHSIVEAAKELKQKSGEFWNDIIAVSVTTVRNTYCFLDDDYKPTRPSITWLDQRLAKKEQKYPWFNYLIFKLGGMVDVVNKQRRMAPSTWMKENQPDIWGKSSHVCLLSAYLNYKLTGRLCDCTASQASRLPYNYKKHRWQKKNELTYTVYNFEREKLCELVEPCDVIGYISEEISKLTGIKQGLPLIATGSDKGCETLGVGALDQSVAAVSFGTAATLQIITDKHVSPTPHMPAYNSVVPGKFTPETQVSRGFWMVTWFKENFAQEVMEEAKLLGIQAEKLLDTKLSAVPAGSEGLILQPYWAPSITQPMAKGAIIGFNDYHTKAHLYKAIIEGVSYALYEGLLNLSKRSGNKITNVSLSGGGSESDAVCQITADMFGLPVSRVQTFETSGLGAAILVFTAMKEFDSLENAVNKMVHFKDTFYPDAVNHELYMQYYNIAYKKIYKQLQPLYEELYQVSNKD